MERRTFLGRTLGVIGVGSILGSVAGIGSQVATTAGHSARSTTPATPPSAFGPTPALTPIGEFYQVNKDLLPTSVNGSDWRLVIDGMVGQPQSLTLADLRALPSIVQYRTFECISTEVVRGDHLIGNQKWRGVRVSDLLDRAGVNAEAKFVVWEAADGFRESIPLDVARLPDTFIAYEMGDAPLPVEHGFPARVLIPGLFGMKQPKWLTRIQLSETDIDGYWVERGWDKQAVVKVMSRIDSPGAGDKVVAGQPFRVYGIANSGARGISRVELSTDEGKTWSAAELEPRGDPLGPLTWVRWRASVAAPAAGTLRIVARATDGSGTVQSAEETSPLPSGAGGLHAIRVIVDAA